MKLALLFILTPGLLFIPNPGTPRSRALSLQSDSSPQENADRRGAIRGHVVVPDIGQRFDRVEAILLPPEWTLDWQGEVQQRLDAYSATYKREIAQNPTLFTEISSRAHQEATRYVLSRMQIELGGGFAPWVRNVPAGGNFAYDDVPVGEYLVVVLAQLGGRGMIWTERVSVDGATPRVLEIENRIQ